MVRRAATVLVCTALLTGCMTGERPTLAGDTVPERSTDGAVAAVLTLLEDPPRGQEPLVARYDVLKKFGNVSSEAVLARDGERTSVTVGDVRYLDGPDGRQTCLLPSGSCSDGFDETKVSDTLTVSTFATESAVTRLRQDARNAIGPARPFQRSVAGAIDTLDGTCVEIDVTGGTTYWCALAEGVLALQDTADMRAELVGLTTGTPPDESWFSPQG